MQDSLISPLNDTLFIRADSTTRMGTGHVMRCLAVAQEWKMRGREVVFIGAWEGGKLRERLAGEGFTCLEIKAPHPNNEDVKVTLAALEESRASRGGADTWLVLDGYHFDSHYQAAIRGHGFRSVVIDDTAHLDKYCADILLNANLHAPGLGYVCEGNPLRLLGCGYALLRREFLRQASWERSLPMTAQKVLVTMGGSDPDNITLKVLEALQDLQSALGVEPEVKVVLGAANPHGDDLRSAIRSFPSRFTFWDGAGGMPEAMKWADLALSGAGSTCWEMAFMGLPFLTVTLADNQKEIAASLMHRGIARNLGWHAGLMQERILASVAELALNRSARLQSSRNGRALIDGRGCALLVDAITGANT